MECRGFVRGQCTTYAATISFRQGSGRAKPSETLRVESDYCSAFERTFFLEVIRNLSPFSSNTAENR